ncbi:hypothetical protein [Streptomyces sp. NPDC056069]|uniref:hypothetical protein n=1 Tax=Streptomyces sp. NPDC056069 TaxID=3345702 RepID=UPI0035E1C5B6
MARWKKRPTANHTRRAEDMRRNPGVWVEVGTYNGRQSAQSTARHIRLADRLPQYTPVGAFETSMRLTDDGAVLYARFVAAPGRCPICEGTFETCRCGGAR